MAEPQLWAIEQPDPPGEPIILAVLPADCGHYARTLAESMANASPQNRPVAALRSRRDIALAMMRAQFGVELTLKVIALPDT